MNWIWFGPLNCLMIRWNHFDNFFFEPTFKKLTLIWTTLWLILKYFEWFKDHLIWTCIGLSNLILMNWNSLKVPTLKVGMQLGILGMFFLRFSHTYHFVWEYVSLSLLVPCFTLAFKKNLYQAIGSISSQKVHFLVVPKSLFASPS